ncbi:hypothetical protein JTB14_024429 [Gonioctena quinquepunctata]|nr:hypothetical protein JTB14_024429 [Gonioctena quinquepunctata]
MKTIFIIFTVLTFSLANVIEFKIDEDLANEFLQKYEDGLISSDGGEIVAVVNEFTDTLFSHVGPFCVNNKLDPANLSDISQSFLGASIKLSKGLLIGISTLARYDDVEVSYEHSHKTLELSLPILFSDLHFTYHFNVILLLVGPDGDMTGTIKDFKANVKLTFDFNTYTAKLQKLSIPNSGDISLTFQGHGIVDSVINILSKFVTTVIHPILTAFIEGIVKNVALSIVTSVNTFVNETLHPHPADVTTTPKYPCSGSLKEDEIFPRKKLLKPSPSFSGEAFADYYESVNSSRNYDPDFRMIKAGEGNANSEFRN